MLLARGQAVGSTGLAASFKSLTLVGMGIRRVVTGCEAGGSHSHHADSASVLATTAVSGSIAVLRTRRQAS